jgi:hypothetical protein
MMTVLLALVLLLASQGPGPATASLSGRVLDGDSQAPIVGARVTISGEHVRQEGITDGDGRFHFPGLPNGRYRVTAEQQGFISTPMNAASPTVAAGTITIAGPTAGVSLPLFRPGVIAGQVFDEHGAVLPRVSVQVVRKATTTGTAGLQGPAVLTNDLGEFRVAPLMAGEYVVLAAPRGGPPTGARTLVPTHYPSTTDRERATVVTLRPGETATGVFITMLSAPAYEITGLVVDEEGRPQPGALIALIVQQTHGQMAMQASLVGTVARPDGTFRLGGLASGTYRLAVSDPPPGPSPPASPADALPALLSTVTSRGGPFTTVEIRDESVSGVRLVLPSR